MIIGRVVDDVKSLSPEESVMLRDQMGFVQFHPSFDYTDFVKGLRPVKSDDDKAIGFERRDGVFKGYCWRAAQKSDSNFDAVYERFITEISDAYSEENPLELKTDGQGKSFYVYPNPRHGLSLVTGPSMKKQGSLTRLSTFDPRLNLFRFDNSPWLRPPHRFANIPLEKSV